MYKVKLNCIWGIFRDSSDKNRWKYYDKNIKMHTLTAKRSMFYGHKIMYTCNTQYTKIINKLNNENKSNQIN